MTAVCWAVKSYFKRHLSLSTTNNPCKITVPCVLSLIQIVSLQSEIERKKRNINRWRMVELAKLFIAFKVRTDDGLMLDNKVEIKSIHGIQSK
jgi:hypothetical protein